MEAPTAFITPTLEEKQKPHEIKFIEEKIVKQDNKEYKIQFGINEINIDEIVVRVSQINSNNSFYFENKYNQKNFQNFSKIFYLYKEVQELISFLKNLKYEIIEKNDHLIIRFNVFLPNGENEFIELKLNKALIDSNILMIK